MALKAFQTLHQGLYWGGVDSLLDLGPFVTTAPILSDVTLVPRPVLGSSYPEQNVARTAYRIQLGNLDADGAAQLLDQPEAICALIQTDAETALVMAAVVSGASLVAAARGIITAQGVPILPTGPPYRCAASALEQGDTAVTDGDHVWVVATQDIPASIMRGTLTVDFDTAGIYSLGSEGATLTATSTGSEHVTGWLLQGVRA